MMIRAPLEHASDVWDPHHVGDHIAYHGTRKSTTKGNPCVLKDYGRFSSAILMLDQ